jgi:hypothetical protein
MIPEVRACSIQPPGLPHQPDISTERRGPAGRVQIAELTLQLRVFQLPRIEAELPCHGSPLPSGWSPPAGMPGCVAASAQRGRPERRRLPGRLADAAISLAAARWAREVTNVPAAAPESGQMVSYPPRGVRRRRTPAVRVAGLRRGRAQPAAHPERHQPRQHQRDNQRIPKDPSDRLDRDVQQHGQDVAAAGQERDDEQHRAGQARGGVAGASRAGPAGGRCGPR